MSDTYSLTKVVRDQIAMIRDSGNEPVLFALENFCGGPGCEVRAVIPVWDKVDYQSLGEMSDEHHDLAKRIAAVLLAQADIKLWFTHDIIFQGWNLPMGQAVAQAARRSNNAYWLHWIHSVPGGGIRDYWTLPENSHLVYPNATDRTRVAEHFVCTERDVLVIPHCSDVRDFMRTDIARNMAETYGLLDAEIVTTFPVPIDRMESKGIRQVIRVLGEIKKLGRSVRLVVAGANYDEQTHSSATHALMEWGEKYLTFDEQLWTHYWSDDCRKGASQQTIRDLMEISNLFIFPTKNETFGFTLAEAALTGQLLVLNANLPMQYEIAGATPLYFQFGSHNQFVEHDDEDAFYEGVARRILFEFDRNPVIQAKTRFRREYNRQAIWRKLEQAIVAVIPRKVAA